MLFNGEMVRAILDGGKTQTRRPLKVQPSADTVAFDDRFLRKGKSRKSQLQHWFAPRNTIDEREVDRGSPGAIVSPFGLPGDGLYVRETWAHVWKTESPEDGHVVEYRADTEHPHPGGWPAEESDSTDCLKWKPSIHMRREDSRIQLSIESVGVENVHGISEEDAKSEGVTPMADEDYTAAFLRTWRDIYGAARPWAWVVEFRVLSVNGKEPDVGKGIGR